MANKQNKKPTAGLSDNEIIEGLRKRDPLITRDCFYGVCRIAYHIYNQRYELERKDGMDFYSIAHEYYLSLDKYNFRQLEDRKPGLSLKTWMVNGFRFVLLDRLKNYNRERRLQSFEERMEKASLRFDVPDNNFAEDFRNTVYEICADVLGRDHRSSIILQMMLIEGFKGKEVAKQLGVTPSAVTQKYHRLMEDVVIPYFKRYYVAPTCGTAMPPALFDMETNVKTFVPEDALSFAPQIPPTMKKDYSNRITPEHITSLKPNEIFVFGSNLAGMHGGGAARTARLYFGAVLGNGDGPQGQSYAIPTMQGGVETIQPYVDKFVSYAKAHPEQTFLVTPIGCGIAGFTPDDIAPLFEDAVSVENIHLPQSFWEELV
jgi:RNA polymerase sigma factor (sigma-70 family)